MQYNAYVDPSNPDDIVLSVPINDNEFDQDEGDEGKANNNNNNNGYMYDIGQQYEQKHNNKDKNNGNHDVPNIVAVSIVDEVDDDDFAERPKVQPAAIGIAPPPKQNGQNKKPKRRNIKSQDKVKLNDKAYDFISQQSSISNESPSPINGNKINGNKQKKQQVYTSKDKEDDDNPWYTNDLPTSDEALLSNVDKNVNHSNQWEQFQD